MYTINRAPCARWSDKFALCMLTVFCGFACRGSSESEATSESASTSGHLNIVGKVSDIPVEITSIIGSVTTSAKIEIAAKATDSQIASGTIIIDHFNAIIDSVDLSILKSGASGTAPIISMWLESGEQAVTYNDNDLTVSGNLTLISHYDDISVEMGPEHEFSDYSIPFKQVVNVSFTMKLYDNLESDPGSEIKVYNGQLLTLEFNVSSIGSFLSYDVIQDIANPADLTLSTGVDSLFFIKKWLPVIPVFYAPSEGDPPSSGVTFPGFQVSTDDIWGRLRNGFEWKTASVLAATRYKPDPVNRPNYIFTQTTACHAEQIVDLDDGGRFHWQNVDPYAIEVYFCKTLQPATQSALGPAYTGLAGTAEAGIIVTDDGGSSGIWESLLAHEMGHVFSFLHPADVVPPYPTGTTGTIMCPAKLYEGVGHPDIQAENHDPEIRNPLLYFQLLPEIPLSPDCTDGNDCGQCPSLP